MTQRLDQIAEIADQYDAIVFDQWGVLHNGQWPYPKSVATVQALRGARPLAVLSNSGKRSGPNAQRIAGIGFDVSAFAQIMTSGEALWRDISQGTVPERHFFPIERAPGDAMEFVAGLDVAITTLDAAEAVLLMGLPDGSTLDGWQDTLTAARARDLPVYCSNPDRASPRGHETVISPGVLAYAYIDMGGTVAFYGKPHRPIFKSLETAIGTGRTLMIGDSLEHDIAGAHGAGWDSLFLSGGLYQSRFTTDNWQDTLTQIAAEHDAPLPTYIMDILQ